MSYTIDDSILANIKEDCDEDQVETSTVEVERLEGETFLEVMGGYSGNISDANVSYEDRIEDPLQEEDEKEIELKEFSWCCMENDFIKTDIYEEKAQEVRVGRSKKAKLETELRSLNGHIWSKIPIAPPVSDHLPEFVVAGKGPAKSVSNPLEAWHLLVDVTMLNMVVKSTNEVIKAVKKKEPHQKRFTDLIELRAWLGLSYLCGVLRNSFAPGPVDELWTLELGNAIFRATMSYKRFEFLTECIRCADQSAACSSSALDEIGNFWEKMVINFRSYYSASGFCMIHDHILDLSHLESSPFNHVLPDQPNLKGLRFITMCDAKTFYICNALVANNEQPLDEEVNHLVSDIKGTQRILCLNEHFTNMELLRKLKQNQLQMAGALKTNADEIPAELQNNSQSPQIWYGKNNITLLSGLDPNISTSGFLATNGLSTRIDSAKLYQTIKNSNETALQAMKVFSTQFGRLDNRRWSLEYFYFMLDMAAYNAWILYRLSENGDAAITQRDFQRQLGLYLTQQQLKHRMHLNIKIPLPLKIQIAEILGENVDALLSGASKKVEEASKLGSISKEKAAVPDGIILQSREIESRRRCRACKSRNGSKTKTRCQQCLEPFCLRHLIFRCQSCCGYKILESAQQNDRSEDHGNQKDQDEMAALEDEIAEADETDL